MRQPPSRACFSRLLSLLLAPGLGRAEFPAGGEMAGMEPAVDKEYKWQPTPLIPASARTCIALHETMVKTLPDQTPFGEVIGAIRAALRGPKDGPPECEPNISS